MITNWRGRRVFQLILSFIFVGVLCNRVYIPEISKLVLCGVPETASATLGRGFSRFSPTKSPHQNTLSFDDAGGVYITNLNTTLPGGAPASGYAIFDNLFLLNGTFYVVTADSSSFPDRTHIIAKPVDNGAGGVDKDPTDAELRFISPNVAQAVLGDRALAMVGMSIIISDSSQYMKHYYHWWGEIILGAIRVYTALGLTAGKGKPLPEISQFIIPHVNSSSWRDRAGLDGPLMHAAFFPASIQTSDYWEDLIKLNRTIVFERAMIVNRIAAHKNKLASKWFKMSSSTMSVTPPRHFWEPLRRRVVRNVLGHLPTVDNAGAIPSLPVVTYISRQGTGRRLTKDDHEGLVKALEGLQEEGICQFEHAVMENMSQVAQMELGAKTTIMVGVHGNGLTHQLWMPPTSRSTVFEIMLPNCYVHDYEFLSRNMGHRHYAVWNDTFLTYEPGTWYEGVKTAQGFHGSSIPVHGPSVAEEIRRRLQD